MSGTGEWATPQNFFDAASKRLGPFHIDLAAKAHNTKCVDYISPERDSLAQDVVWINNQHTTCWLNPPFSNIKDWIKKAYEQAQLNRRAKIVVLCRIAPSTKWWMNYVPRADEVLLIGGKRVQFEPPPNTESSSNPQECCLMVFTHNDYVGYDNPEIYTWDWTEE